MGSSLTWVMINILVIYCNCPVPTSLTISDPSSDNGHSITKVHFGKDSATAP